MSIEVIQNRMKRFTALDTLRFVGNVSDDIEVRTYLVGGAVRDVLINKPNKDLDFVCSNSKRLTNALADRIKQKTGKRPTIAIVKDKLTYKIRAFGNELEFVDPRKESYTRASFKPKVTRSKEFIDDAMRRDFTLNALYLGIQKDNWMKIIDLTGKGRMDLREKRLRTPKNPDITFEDDPTRILRLARFRSCKGFRIERKTLASAKRKAIQIKRVPVQLQKVELDRGILCNSYIQTLDDIGLLKVIFPEVTKLKNLKQPEKYHKFDAYVHTLKVVEYLPKLYVLRWVGLFHDIGKYPNFQEYGNFHGHAKLSRDMSLKIMKRLKFSNNEMRYIREMVYRHQKITMIINSNYSMKAVRRFVIENEIYVKDLIIFVKADIKAKGKKIKEDLDKIKIFEKKIASVKKIFGDKFQLAINGKDIMNTLKIPASRKVGMILKDLKEAVIEKEIKNNRKDLINFIKKKY